VYKLLIDCIICEYSGFCWCVLFHVDLVQNVTDITLLLHCPSSLVTVSGVLMSVSGVVLVKF
jgi:hypothetical protein